MTHISRHRPRVTGTPEIIAHRGASREYKENTLPAFARPLELGADAIELDVHGTQDGILVVHHDPVISLADGTISAPIASLTWQEITSFDLSGNFAIPTLDEVLGFVGTSATVYVEVKGAHIEPLVAKALSQHMSVDAAVHSFDHRIPVNVRSLSPGLSIGLLSDSYPIDVRSLLLPTAAEAWWQNVELIDEAMVRDVHAAGARVIAWTVNDPAQAKILAQWGVDGLCTDIAGDLRAIFSK